ncbi:MAG: hypothetical protein LBC31_06570 [Treponema sp.]|jgi:hypothetical protein|nr:hypothetical protein [Treponema sp.]
MKVAKWLVVFSGIFAAAAGFGGCENPWMKDAVAPLRDKDKDDPSSLGLSREELWNVEDFGLAAIDGTFNVTNTGEWNAAITAINAGGNNKNYIINLLGSVGVPASNFGPVTGLTVSLRGGTLSCSDSGMNLLTVAGQNLVIRDCILQGDSDNGKALLKISGGTVQLKSGGIKDNTSTDDGGGVYVYGGTFTMYGGEISHNTSTGIMNRGGGVCVTSGGTFTMYGGEISHNTSTGGGNCGGGVCVISGGTFTMNEGTITCNSAAFGGGVYVESGFVVFNKAGGTIYGSDGGADANSAAMFGQGYAVYAETTIPPSKYRDDTVSDSIGVSGGSHSGTWY